MYSLQEAGLRKRDNIVLKLSFKAFAIICFYLIASGSVSATERHNNYERLNIVVSTLAKITSASSTKSTDLPPARLLLVAEGCLAKCERESRACDERNRDDDGSNGDVCERAYIKCDRACGD